MMFGRKGLVFDVETNGLLDEVSQVYCISFKDMITGSVATLRDESLNRATLLQIFRDNQGRPIIGHNILHYDYEILRMFFNLDLIECFGIESVVDTLLLSKTLYPDRPLPKGCPTSVHNKELKITRKIGPHSLEAWGYRCGESKIEIHEWRVFDESIIDRCEVDVSITEKVYYRLMSEAKIPMED